MGKLIRFGREICGDLQQAERREWWLSNGLGAYAAGTIAGSLTRRYHGMLIAPVTPPLGRHLVVAKIDAAVEHAGRSYPLYTNRWGDGSIEPRGFLNIESFELEGRVPVWRHACGPLIVESRVWMEQGHHTTYAAFRLVSAPVDAQPVTISAVLLVNARDHHVNARPWEFHPMIEAQGTDLRVRYRDGFLLTLRAAGGTMQTRHQWYENFDLPLERERGLPDRDNHLCAGVAQFTLHPEQWSGVVASLEENPSPYLAEALRRAQAADACELKRTRVQVPEMSQAPDWIDQLVLAAGSFVFSRPLADVPDGESVIAGYPWFGDWGRDTMIALPGLALATGRFSTARNILRTFARFVDQGMLPNVFPGAGDRPEYNTADAALWYIEAWRAYLDVIDDQAALREAFPVLESIMDWHLKGTRYGIGADPEDGLLRAGERGVQLTWMDAKIGDWVVTPRIGKPVEINALWYNALSVMARLAARLGRPADRYLEHAARVRASFARFVNPINGALYDVTDGTDATLRPNQIFAVSLPYVPLDRQIQASVVRVVGAELLTSYGLRSLNPTHPDYRSHYAGGVWERDSAYHQGPVWAWLLGHYALAEYRVTGNAQAAQQRLEPLRDHLLDAGLGTVSEIFDGAAPHTARGTPSQAWSVACALEAWWRLEKAKTASNRQDAKSAREWQEITA
jgi:4-alpha-glucanotransferase